MVRTKYVYRWEDVPVIIDLPYVAVLLGVSVECLKKWAQRGKIPAFKVGKLWRISKYDLLAFIEQNKVSPPQLEPH
ncbi:helix-turn-helix domain-containing protein [Clostridium sp. MSTE9]|uniref:helix-turn-helix domain-containing protein n=1 Tax=Clostridium sp. (strain MSTE9) TaxID=1105031 RepID=UPI0005510EBF|nr:helix-turn-helix domain-containing protein [Clostridium sp. MSTE9]